MESVMNKQDLIMNLKDRIAYSQDEQGRYEEMHGDLNAKSGDMHSLWSEMADWHKGRVCAYNAVIEMLDDTECL